MLIPPRGRDVFVHRPRREINASRLLKIKNPDYAR
jgi:hypothetical protein